MNEARRPFRRPTKLSRELSPATDRGPIQRLPESALPFASNRQGAAQDLLRLLRDIARGLLDRLLLLFLFLLFLLARDLCWHSRAILPVTQGIEDELDTIGDSKFVVDAEKRFFHRVFF